MPPVYEMAPSDIPNPDAPVITSVVLPTGTMPPVLEAALSAATIDKPLNPILEPSEKLRFSDNVLEVTVKLTNPMERRICLRVEASADIDQRYGGVDGRGILDSKEAALVSFTLLQTQRLLYYSDNVCLRFQFQFRRVRFSDFQEF
jgi:hypothetical protein